MERLTPLSKTTDVVEAINYLLALSPGMNFFTRKTIEDMDGRVDSVEKELEELTKSINEIAGFLNKKIDRLAAKDHDSYGFVFRSKFYCFYTRKLINK